LHTDLAFVAWVESIRGRKIVTRAKAFNGDELIAEAEGLFISVDFEALRSSLE
jgi:acyl-CoA thioesterase FadM